MNGCTKEWMNNVGVTEAQMYCFGWALSSFSIPQIGTFFWQWDSPHLHPPGRSHWSDLQGRSVMISVFIGPFSPTVLSVTSQKWKAGQVTTYQSSHCDSLSFQASWQMHIDFSQCMFTAALGLTKSLQPPSDWISTVSPTYVWGSWVI